MLRVGEVEGVGPSEAGIKLDGERTCFFSEAEEVENGVSKEVKAAEIIWPETPVSSLIDVACRGILSVVDIQSDAESLGEVVSYGYGSLEPTPPGIGKRSSTSPSS